MKTLDIERVQKVTSKGQITLPSAWRKTVGTDNVVVRARGRVLTVQPAHFEEDDNETIIFSAKRDNGGKGIPISEFIRILEKHKKQDEKIRKAASKIKRKK